MPAFIQDAGGYLSTYKEELSFGWKTSAEIIELVAIENSINPRLLLAMLEYQSGWVYAQPSNLQQTDYPMGNADFHTRGLYRQLSWAVQHLSIGYYGWRAGILSEITFSDGTTMRLAPQLNAGTVALQTFMAKGRTQRDWETALYAAGNITELYEEMFGNPWLRAQTVEPLYPPSLTQPPLELPFRPGAIWSFSGGPHSAWGPNGALAAIDFAPGSTISGCIPSNQAVTPMAAGLVVRSENGVVVLDLDGDGREQTGWAIMYLHIYSKNRVPAGNWMEMDQIIGYPSCEGGVSTGTHVHVARKYNGEWILADGPLPFVLSGWQAVAGDHPYSGFLVNGGNIIPASQVGSFESRIVRGQ
jgi:LasA protease